MPGPGMVLLGRARAGLAIAIWCSSNHMKMGFKFHSLPLYQSGRNPRRCSQYHPPFSRFHMARSPVDGLQAYTDRGPPVQPHSLIHCSFWDSPISISLAKYYHFGGLAFSTASQCNDLRRHFRDGEVKAETTWKYESEVPQVRLPHPTLVPHMWPLSQIC